MEGLLLILLFGGVMIITAVLFSAWLLAMVVKLIFNVVGTVVSGGRQAPRAVVMRTRTCPHRNCAAANSNDAQFCRRCGRMMGPAQRVYIRRAAMW
jgi:hypothetical protein